MLLENLSPSPVDLVQPTQQIETVQPTQVMQPVVLMEPNTIQPQTQGSPVVAEIKPVVNRVIIVFHILLWIFFFADIATIPVGGFLAPVHLFFYISTILITCLTTPIWKYLKNKTTNEEILEIMQSHFSKAPIITLTTKSYHISGMGSDKSRWNTHQENVDFKYYSWKDISGTFHLDLSQTKEKPIYLLLRVKNDINFADSISIDDYLRVKKELYARNAHRDENIEETEERTYEGYKEYMMVRLGKEDSCFFSRCVFVIMLMFSLGLVFCLKFQKKTISQSFVVRKLVSTRYNLLEGENSMKYGQLKPMVSIDSNVYEYNDQVTGCVYEENKMAPPSAEDLERAKMYEKDVPTIC